MFVHFKSVQTSDPDMQPRKNPELFYLVKAAKGRFTLSIFHGHDTYWQWTRLRTRDHVQTIFTRPNVSWHCL